MLLQWPVTLLSREPGAAMQRILKARLQRDMFSLLICLPTLSHIRLNIYYYYSAPSLHSRYAIGNALTCTGGHYYHIQIRLGSNEFLLMSNRHMHRHHLQVEASLHQLQQHHPHQSSMLSPSFNILWILLPKVFGSSKLNPEVRRAVSKRRSTRSFKDLSFLSASALFLSSSVIAFYGLISIVFLLDM
ncbi:hypothetical protein F2Q69_00027826 [Brassica cretica]|uniref:Uncharacterized protein n=1 Tax=Brassica cretica TaxID=69181 RepID=A0A8S9SDA4_BRACR|nr:hypothetical protein F2Q69_00027826 [Brassica cretica]